MAQPTKAIVEFTARIAAFGTPCQRHQIQVDDVNVRVLDSVAGYYTLCHGLEKKTVTRLIRRAAGK